jgi:2-oxoglutarate ferredoxin oxidoreductase subunit delta
MAKRKGRVKVEASRCKACGLCVEFCPKDCLESADHMNAIGYIPMRFKEGSDCTACGNCAQMCPDMAIQVYFIEETPVEAYQ